jgi:hypothetical protein
MSRHASPYLADNGRLGDVIAAIQAMGTYKFYKLSFEEWAKRISGDRARAAHWRRVFEDHPEFFRLNADREAASLVWRRQYPKRYHVDEGRALKREEYKSLSSTEKKRISRNALTAADIQALISTAINLHSRALEHQKEGRWWVALVIGLVSAAGGFIGAILGH